MAVHIKLIKNNIKSSSSYGKYFAKTVSQGEVTLDEIAAVNSSTVEPSYVMLSLDIPDTKVTKFSHITKEIIRFFSHNDIISAIIVVCCRFYITFAS